MSFTRFDPWEIRLEEVRFPILPHIVSIWIVYNGGVGPDKLSRMLLVLPERLREPGHNETAQFLRKLSGEERSESRLRLLEIWHNVLRRRKDIACSIGQLILATKTIR